MSNTIRNRIKGFRDSKYLIYQVFYHIIYFFWWISKLTVNPRFRSEQISRIRYTKKIFQVSTYTKDNRYPTLFNQVVKELEDVENPKILSFGSSTGEEVFSLKRMISDSDIIGVDINRWCVKIANRRNEYSKCVFLHTSDPIWQVENSFDCILAMAVFQKSIHRNPNTSKSIDSFTYDIFKNAVNQLDRLLKPNGIFVIDQSDYQFADLDLFEQKYYAITASHITRRRPIFNAENLKTIKPGSYIRMFRKSNHYN